MSIRGAGQIPNPGIFRLDSYDKDGTKGFSESEIKKMHPDDASLVVITNIKENPKTKNIIVKVLKKLDAETRAKILDYNAHDIIFASDREIKNDLRKIFRLKIIPKKQFSRYIANNNKRKKRREPSFIDRVGNSSQGLAEEGQLKEPKSPSAYLDFKFAIGQKPSNQRIWQVANYIFKEHLNSGKVKEVKIRFYVHSYGNSAVYYFTFKNNSRLKLKIDEIVHKGMFHCYMYKDNQRLYYDMLQMTLVPSSPAAELFYLASAIGEKYK